MSSALPYMQFYVADYLADTFDLSTEEHGIYLLLLMISWRRGGTLPNDYEYLRKAINSCAKPIHGNHFNKLVPALLERFFQQDSQGNWANKRLGKELEKARKRSGTARESAGKRWGNSRETKGADNKNSNLGNALASDGAMPTQCYSESDKNREDKSPPLGPPQGADDAFDHHEGTVQRARGTRIPLEFSPDAVRLSKAQDLGLQDEEIREIVREFVSYWSDIPGSRGLRVNWQGTFENRLSEIAGRKKTSNGKYNIRDSIDTALQFRRSEEARRSGREGSGQDPALLSGLRKGSA